MINNEDYLAPLKSYEKQFENKVFTPTNIWGKIQIKSFLPTSKLLFVFGSAILVTLLFTNTWMVNIYISILIISGLTMIWQPFHYLESKQEKDKWQLHYYIQHYPVYYFREHYLFIKDFSARPFAYVYTKDLQKVTRLSSKVQYDKLFKKDIKSLKNNQEVELNGFLDTAFNELKEKRLPIIKF